MFDECSRRDSERQLVTSLLCSRAQVQQAQLAEPEKPKSRTEVRERKAREMGCPICGRESLVDHDSNEVREVEDEASREVSAETQQCTSH